MHEAMTLVGAGLAGLLLGGFFFAGLWWTVRRGISASRPALLFASSLLLRSGVTIAGFYLVGDGQWQRLLACLLGFLVARFVVVRLAGQPAEPAHAPAKGARHAP